MHLDGGEEGNSETYIVYRFGNMEMCKKGKLNMKTFHTKTSYSSIMLS